MTKPFEKPIYVAQPFLPPLDEFYGCMKEIWDSHWLTNEGPIVRRFERELSDYFKTGNVCLFTNGTLALQIGLEGMGIAGEVITTPFTFVATTHSLFWNKIRPVFVDIKPDCYTLDPEKVEAAITPLTTAILAVHVFGHPCDINALSNIARRHKLKLIYDAAHAFGVRVGDKPLAHFGDMSMYSFHATKPYHSLEGGMLTFCDPGLKDILNYLKNFGFASEIDVVMPGTNAKMNEMQALMGSIMLRYVDQITDKHRLITEVYRARLKNIPGIKLPIELPEDVKPNYVYMPIEIDETEFGLSRDELFEELKKYNVYARRYFYPLICDYSCYKSLSVRHPLTVARKVASRILTLPIYHDLMLEDVERICDIIAAIAVIKSK